ncbi:hypothetical protein [Streptacidiphilus sp. EB103A]|uniref:hypothetical protein n=1 Tax=Streptacidiphilus sp. EB103A TaxID=3156275 RepID=UPI003516DCD8
MIVALMFKVLPGPAWFRVLLLALLVLASGVLLWADGFRWLMEHFGASLGGSPVSGG